MDSIRCGCEYSRLVGLWKWEDGNEDAEGLSSREMWVAKVTRRGDKRRGEMNEFVFYANKLG